jgi:uncharacterized protein
MRYLYSLLFTLFAFCAWSQDAINDVPEKPNPPRLVNDYTGMLTDLQKDELERKLDAYDKSTSNQIAVVLVPDMKGHSPVDFATAIGRKWKLGLSGRNNGIVLLISLNPRKIFIAVGEGLQGEVTDITAGYIIDNELKPHLKINDAYGGINNATDKLIDAIAGKFKAPKGYRDRNSGGSGNVFLLIFLLVLLFVIFFGSHGGPRGGMMSRRGYRRWHDNSGGGFFPVILPGGFNDGGGGFSGGGGGFDFGGGGGFDGGGAGGDW